MRGRADDAPTTRGARRWALATAVSPLTLPLLGFGVAVVLGPITGGESGDLAWNWAFVTLFGMPVFGPGIVTTLIGAILLGRRYTTPLTALGLILLVAASGLTIATGIEENLDPATSEGPRLVPTLSPAQLPIFAIPYALTILACLETARRLWTAARGRPPRPAGQS